MTIVKQIIESGNFSEKEIEVLKFLNDALANHFGDTFTDVDLKDIAEGLGVEINSAKGLVGSLMKKNILQADHFTGGDGKNYECFYFAEQEEMEYQPISEE